MPGIEFVDPAAGSGPEQELDPASRQTRSPRARRAVRFGAAAVLIAVAGSLLVAALRRQDGGTPGAHGGSVSRQVTSGAPPSAPITGVVTAAGPSTAVFSAAPPPLPVPGPACPTARLCRTSARAPTAVLDALGATFPGAVVDRFSSVLTGTSKPGLLLRSRSVRAHVAVVTIAVEVRPARAGDTSQIVFADAVGDRGVSVAVTDAHPPWTVVITVVDPTRPTPDIAPASTLAADPRLLSIGI